MPPRALHFVLKIGNRKKNIQFFRDILSMKVLRHEEFQEQCQAQCNGPYDGKWSKTMIGYGPEKEHFVLELTYNYGISHYKLGNDLVAIRIDSVSVFQNIIDKKFSYKHKNPHCIVVNSPDGYLFEIYKMNHEKSLITEVVLSTFNLQASKNYWHNILGMNLHKEDDKSFIASFRDQDTKLEMVSTSGEPVRHEQGYGRIAFSCPDLELPEIQKTMIKNNQTILTKIITLDTPGKAAVQVLILADVDKHEICFVGEKGFDKLSEVDPKANDLIEKAIADDKSEEWFKKRGVEKEKCE